MRYIVSDPPTLISLSLAAAFLFSCGLVIHLSLRMRRLLGGDAKNIEETIVALHKDLNALEKAKENLETKLAQLEKRQKKSIREVSTIRFNPFKGTSGSNQSFVTAFLSEEGDGVVLSSMYSRERVSLFAKPIKSFLSDYELTEEEREAIARVE